MHKKRLPFYVVWKAESNHFHQTIPWCVIGGTEFILVFSSKTVLLYDVWDSTSTDRLHQYVTDLEPVVDGPDKVTC